MARKLSVDRRDFLKSAAVTGAAALVPGSEAAAAPTACVRGAGCANGAYPAA